MMKWMTMNSTQFIDGFSVRNLSSGSRLGRLLLVWLVLVCALLPAFSASRIWTGAHATSGHWSRNANWDTGAPVNGDTVVFPSGTARLANTNDIAGLQLTAIRFIGTGGGYAIRGNAINLGERLAGENSGGLNAVYLARITLDAAARITQEAGGALIVESDVRLNGNDLSVHTIGSAVMRGSISGDGNVFKTGANSLTLGGAAGNTFTGDVFVNAGTLVMEKVVGQSVPHRLVIGDGVGGGQADAAISRANHQVSDVVVNASGLWSLGDYTEEVSTLRLNEGGDVSTGAAGRLILGNEAGITVTPVTTSPPAVSFISGNLELGAGRHVIEVGENTAVESEIFELSINAAISGTLLSGLTKEGRGDLSLGSSNTFGGQVVVNAGVLWVSHPAALGGVGTLGSTSVNNDASLGVAPGVDVVDEVLRLNSTGRPERPALRSSGVSSWTGDITLQRNTSIGVAPGGHFTLISSIGGPGGLVKENTGTLRLAGNTSDNTYAGTTFVNAGTLELDKGTIGGLVAVPGLLVVGDGLGGDNADVVRHRKDNQVNQVKVNGSGFWDLDEHEEEVASLELNEGGDVATGASGKLRLGFGVNLSVTPISTSAVQNSKIFGRLELMLGSHTITVGEGPATRAGFPELIIFASVEGVGALRKNGPGRLEMSGGSNYAGTTVIEEGELKASHPFAFGSTLSGTRVESVGSLSLNGVNITGESLTLDSVGAPGTGGTTNPNGGALLGKGSCSWSDSISILRAARVDVAVGGVLDLSGPIAGNGGLIKQNVGTLTLSGNSANTYSGSTIVNEGRLQLNKAGVNSAVPGRLIIGDDVGGANADVVECLSVNELGALSAVIVNSSGQLIARQEAIGALAGSGNVSVSSSLNTGADNASTTFSGIISGAGGMNKTGTGTFTLTGNNSHTGGTGIAAGTLLVNGQQPASFILIQPAGTLGGSGRVGNLSSFAGGATVSPGASPGRLSSGNVILGAGTVFRVELDGPIAGTQHDQLRVVGSVNLGGATLQAVLNFIPTLGQPIVIIDNDGTDDVVDQFNGLPEGATIRLNQIPFVISYEGGDGNDVTLTATNTSISFVSTRVEAGNGNGVVDANECNHLFVALMNETGSPLAVSRVVLDSATPGVVVTQQRSDYANFGALAIRTNGVPFQFRTAPDFECGRPIEFLLTITVTGGGGGTFTIPFTVASGGAGEPVMFNQAANTPLVDQGQLVSALNVSGAAPRIGKVTVSLHITHPSAGDLVLRLQSPSGTVVPLALNLGGTTDNYGGGCGNQGNRTTFDDDAPVRIAAGTAPFIGSFTPDSPLSAFRGEDPNGDWKLLIADTVAGDTGELRCWSLFVAPAECMDGGGVCESCAPSFTGRFSADMPSTTTRLVRNGLASGCGSAKVCPSVTSGLRLFYRVHLVTNNGPATCVSAVLNDLCRASNLRLHAAAYLGTYNPTDPCANYLGDTGSELAAGSASFSFAAPENAVIAIVVSSPVATSSCLVSYQMQFYGLPCPPPALRIARTANPDEVRLHWSTAYPGFDLQRTPSLNGIAPFPFVNVPVAPVVVEGDYTVTNSSSGTDAYFRLRKP